MTTLANCTAVVTGGGSGVGAAIALALARRGANLHLVGRRLSALEAVAARVDEMGGAAAPWPTDLSDAAALDVFIGKLAANLPSLDVLVHSAGMIERAPVERSSISGLDRHYAINVRAPYLLTKALLPALRAKKGFIVFINSSAAAQARAETAQYDASKHALKAFADSLRAEVNADGVRVLSMFLGRTASDIQARLHQEAAKTYRPELLLQPDDVASTIMHALSLPETAEITDIHIRPAIKT